MIKFFRNIRQKLLRENKTMSYLKYATGEIILVVIGILIALQVNNWNEHQKEKATEQKVLKALLKEFQGNQKGLDQAIKTSNSNLKATVEIGKYTGPQLPDYNGKELNHLIADAFAGMPKVTPSLGTLLEVINSGKLGVISNRNLRSELSSFESVLDNVHSQENFVILQGNNAAQFFFEEGNFRNHLNTLNFDLSGMSPSKFPPNNFLFLENPQFENYLYLYMATLDNLEKNSYSPLKAKQDKIIQLIESEIK
ncbi:DUF6090 family protein [Gaetbulibacter aestuarii]|uniref:DUF6090 family protein n=1 Tax=Gaetbulibacter aestuarii TaxID=1502358 RepID=A0ABW7MV78_9FLAO